MHKFQIIPQNRVNKNLREKKNFFQPSSNIEHEPHGVYSCLISYENKEKRITYKGNANFSFFTANNASSTNSH